MKSFVIVVIMVSAHEKVAPVKLKRILVLCVDRIISGGLESLSDIRDRVLDKHLSGTEIPEALVSDKHHENSTSLQHTLDRESV